MLLLLHPFLLRLRISQLLLDLQALKACLLRLPSSPSQPEVPQTWVLALFNAIDSPIIQVY